MSDHPEFKNLHVVDHPLVQHKLTIMRKKSTPTGQFRQLLTEISMLMGYEISRHIPLTTENIETPLQEYDAPVLAGRKPAIISILRAGLGMVEGLRSLMPNAREGHVGLFRDPETKMPEEYYVKLPEPGGRLFILCDPMLATGNSAVHAMDVLVKHGVEVHNIRFMALVAAPEGIRTFQEKYPNVHIYTASLDEGLDDHAYIRPGLGDAGDRLFGTK
ncbi:uracil phosphoribosyltransferase [Curvivirga aplysinae]|uniref:uracil phosphoribosyltransferase n=1 Tax=Curvivirga aplysinae TaxID=2529852 RepID=UPI0012BD6B96|nr:uracil phosphoribosyltransferase [Curvivirga aplysinae]MTI09049.1 uracil phosphoribosyltransferase [Curvivirga aplysinae]